MAALKRDLAIDAIRGLCIVSMAFAHLAVGGLGWQVTHSAVWFDGAMGFVFLSGLVVGLVYRKVIERRSLRSGQVKAMSRARLVYVWHVALCVAAFVAAALYPASDYANVESQGGIVGSILRTLSLQISPKNASILSLYAVLLVMSAAAFWLLRRGQWKLLLGAVSGLYVLGQVFQTAFTFPRDAGAEGFINWGTWQALFMLALVAGWHWREAAVQRVARSNKALAAATVLSVAIIASAYVLVRTDVVARGPLKSMVLRLFDDGTLGPGSILLAVALLVVLYRAAGWATVKAPTLTRPVITLGQGSLDCYIILSMFTVLVQFEASWWVRDLYAVGVLAAAWCWCNFRAQRKTSKATGSRASLSGAAV